MAADTDNSYRLVVALFLHLLGIIYLIAFVSIGVQIEGLAGSEGIQPFSEELEFLRTQPGIAHYFQVPNLFWLNASDQALNGAVIAGCIAALLIIFNRLRRLALIAAFVLYLSIYHACLPYTNFQWDGLLLEAGFLAIFLSPGSQIVIFLFRWLLFRLRFMSGISKLSTHDPTWADFTALNYYFEVQPLPNPVSWYAHHLPEWLLRFGTFSTLVVELLVPLMMFLPRRWRFLAAWLTILWQVLIILTSNHNWFNFLTIALCLFLFDDQAVKRIMPGWFQTMLYRETVTEAGPGSAARFTHVVLAGLILVTSAGHFWELIIMERSSGVLRTMLDYGEAYRVVSKYHVFPTMRTERLELEILGSVDGKEWKPYAFKYKPGDLSRRPGIVIPHQPRLDWQLWFVTLHPMHLPLFQRFLEALLDNSPTVTALLEENPFAEDPPRQIRVDVYRYRFTDPEQRAATGNWWQRESLGPFGPLPWVQREPVGEESRDDDMMLPP